jgi:hypothetical protein
MTRAEIIEAVKARIDELSPYTDNSLNPGIELIDKVLNEATRSVLRTFPLYVLPTDDLPIIDLVAGQDASGAVRPAVGYLPLPDDFLRLAAFRMNGWKKTVTKVIYPDTPEYEKQSNDVLMGNNQKPVVALTMMSNILNGGIGDENGDYLVDSNDYYITGYSPTGKCLEYYSVPSGEHTILSARYVPDLLPESCPDDLINPIAWSAASIVLQSMKQAEGFTEALKRVELIKTETL